MIILFSLHTHTIIHLFEKWEDFGSFVDSWCFRMERECKSVKSMVKPNQHSVTLRKRLSLLISEQVRKIYQYKYSTTSCYKWGKGKNVKNPNNTMNISDKLKRFRQKYKIEAKENVEVYELLKLDTRDTRTNLKTGANYAKIKIKFVRVMKILRLKSLEHEEVMIQFAEVDTVNNWANCFDESLQFVFLLEYVV